MTTTRRRLHFTRWMLFGGVLLSRLVPGLAADSRGSGEPGAPSEGDRSGPREDATESARREMVNTIHLYGQTGPHPIRPGIEAAMMRVPRHEFVPENLRAAAYKDTPLPIGHRQTISEPYIVALMTELASIDNDDVVLEVGTGSGYQAAVLSRLVSRVYSIEIIEALGRQAERTLQRLGYDNVQVRIGDGYKGWPEHAPFDAILVTAAPEKIPEPLIEQLRPGGRLVVPVGSTSSNQQLTVLEKRSDGSTTTRVVLPVRFVPLTRSAE